MRNSIGRWSWLLLDPRVDASREAVERLGSLSGEGWDLLLGQTTEAKQTVAAIRRDSLWADHFGEAAERPTADSSRSPPEAILRQREPVPDEQVTGGLGVDVRRTRLIADDPEPSRPTARQLRVRSAGGCASGRRRVHGRHRRPLASGPGQASGFVPRQFPAQHVEQEATLDAAVSVRPVGCWHGAPLSGCADCIV